MDLVYTYVNGHDPVWRAKRAAYLVPQHNPAIRFEGIDEIYWSVRSALRFLPWLRTIYIVTDGQRPPLRELTDPRIQVVDHRAILPEELLPVFFSDVIESYLHRIPGLSDIFLYNNDDFFFGAPVSPDDVVQDGQLQIINTFDVNKVRTFTSEYSVRLMYTCDVLHAHGIPGPYRNNHCTKVLRRSTCQQLETDFAAELHRLRSNRFRVDDCIQYLFLVLNVDPASQESRARTAYHETVPSTVTPVPFVCLNNLPPSQTDAFEAYMAMCLGP